VTLSLFQVSEILALDPFITRVVRRHGTLPPVSSHCSRKADCSRLFAHLHALGGDAPFGFVEVDLRPLRLAQFTRPDEDKRGKPQRALGGEETFVSVYRAEQCADALRLDDGGMMLFLRWGQGTAKIARRIALRSARRLFNLRSTRLFCVSTA